MKDNWLPLVLVAAEKIEECKCEPDENLKKDIAQNGLRDPIIIKKGHADIFICVNGKHRYQALKELGWKIIPCKLQ